MNRRCVVLALVVFGALIAAPRVSVTAADTPQRRPIALEDILAWKTIGSATVSNDGGWFAYRLSPVQGDGEIVIRRIHGDKEVRFPAGEVPPPPDNPPAADGPPPPPARLVVFSDDSHFAAFTVYPTAKDAAQLRRQNRPIQNKAGLVNLDTLEKIEFDRVKRFAFAGERGRWIALHRYGPADAPAGPGASPAGAAGAPRAPERPRGSDLILHDLQSGAEQNVGNVADFAFDKRGRFLAWTIDAQDKVGNGLVVRNMESGVVSAVDSDKASYERPTWTEKGDALAAVKGADDRKLRDKLYSLIGCTDLDAASPRKVSFTLPADAPAGFTISPNRNPMWTDDLGGILFGIHEVRPKDASDRDAAASIDPPAGGAAADPAANAQDELPSLMLWHYRDPRLQSQQQVQEPRDKNFSYLAEYRVKDNRFLPLADESLRDVTPAPLARWASGRDIREYELGTSLDGRQYADLYAVNLETGERKLAAKKVGWSYAPAPDGTKLLYYADGQYYVYDMPSGQTKSITKNATVDFWNTENDVNVVKPPIPPIGWTKDGASVLLSDGWDVWKAPAAGGALTNLTVNGRKDGVRYRRRISLDPDEKGIDLSAPVYFDAYAEWTKKQGIARFDGGRPGPTVLAWDDAVTSIVKAKRADVLLYTRQTYKDYPDYYAGDPELKNGRRITDANPQQKGFAWSSGSMLISYTSAKGDKLQGALYLPANYEKGKSYPTVVYIYERLSQQLNQYATPGANGFNKSVYTSNGYAVLEPDIKYRVNDPGMSAVWCVVPAVRAAIATGVVDAAKVGIQGHSWGGYQTAFLVTQTDAFAAAVAGAPLTDMISMANLIYKNTGGSNEAIFESAQGRFFGGPWDNLEAYIRNSPVLHAKNVRTPLMILHNDKDGAVDFTQGVEYYNTLRRMGKPVVMLEYLGENHGLRKPVNQQDYTVRMKEFFDHHLMGKPAPEWLISGVPRLKMDEHLKQRQQERKAAPGVRISTEIEKR